MAEKTQNSAGFWVPRSLLSLIICLEPCLVNGHEDLEALFEPNISCSVVETKAKVQWWSIVAETAALVHPLAQACLALLSVL